MNVVCMLGPKEILFGHFVFLLFTFFCVVFISQFSCILDVSGESSAVEIHVSRVQINDLNCSDGNQIGV
jgi:hypothetical protein